MYMKVLLLGLLTLLSLRVGQACKGCLTLDTYNIYKILPRFKAVLVKFDVAYPYGEKHEAFEKVAEDIVGSKDLVLAQVGIKDYGEKDNEELGKKYGITSKEQLPKLKLFLNGKDEPISFSQDSDWTADNIRAFIRKNSDIYIGLSGCLEDFDKLASSFMTTKNRESKLKEAEKLTEEFTDENKSIATTYIKFMKKILETDHSFVGQEIVRLNKLLKGAKMTDKKKRELADRVNILQAFAIPKDEL